MPWHEGLPEERKHSFITDWRKTMSVKEYQRFASLLTAENVAKNPELRTRLKLTIANSDSEGLVQLGREHGCDFTVEDIRAFQERHGDELSDEDLQNVAGGSFDPSLAAIQAAIAVVGYGAPTVAVYAAPVSTVGGGW